MAFEKGLRIYQYSKVRTKYEFMKMFKMKMSRKDKCEIRKLVKSQFNEAMQDLMELNEFSYEASIDDSYTIEQGYLTVENFWLDKRYLIGQKYHKNTLATGEDDVHNELRLMHIDYALNFLAKLSGRSEPSDKLD